MKNLIALSLLFTVLTLPLAAQEYHTREWFKGNTHTHSLWSDGNDFPEMISSWYKERGYDFLALSDHDILQNGEKWMSLDAITKRQRSIGRTAVQKCEERFGKDWIQWETRKGAKGVVLKTLAECRETLEEPGKFYLLPAEEISNSGGGKPVHINALNITEVIPSIKDGKVSAEEVMRRSLKKVKEYGEKTGRPVLAHVNHPNFQWALTAENLAAVADGAYFEIYNGHPGINHNGDAKRPGDEAIWDIANTIRIAEMDSAPLLGVATDDSHTYHGGDVSPGRGWIVVGAESLDGDSIINAMLEGKFYCSSGVTIDNISFDKDTGKLDLVIAAVEGAEFTTEFIGTRTSYDAAAETTGIGEVFATEKGTEVSFTLPKDALYLRATITSSERHENASFKGQQKQAWIQPVGWRK